MFFLKLLYFQFLQLRLCFKFKTLSSNSQLSSASCCCFLSLDISLTLTWSFWGSHVWTWSWMVRGILLCCLFVLARIDVPSSRSNELVSFLSNSLQPFFTLLTSNICIFSFLCQIKELFILINYSSKGISALHNHSFDLNFPVLLIHSIVNFTIDVIKFSLSFCSRTLNIVDLVLQSCHDLIKTGTKILIHQ